MRLIRNYAAPLWPWTAAGLLAAAAAVQAAPNPQALDQIDDLVQSRILAQAERAREPGHDSKSGEKSAMDAVRETLKRHKGKVLSVTREEDGYRIKLLDNGNLRILLVPAE